MSMKVFMNYYSKCQININKIEFKALVPESIPLVEALLHDLLATTHNLKVCKEQKYFSSMFLLSSIF